MFGGMFLWNALGAMPFDLFFSLSDELSLHAWPDNDALIKESSSKSLISGEHVEVSIIVQYW